MTEFRYAFSGVGDVPLAVILCSDGMDGSLRTKESLYDFYEQIIGLHLDGDDVDRELADCLPTLSVNGSRDDISLAGIVNLTDADMSGLKKTMEIKKKERNISNEYKLRKLEIETIEEKIETLTIKLERLKYARFMKQSELDNLLNAVKAKEKDVAELDSSADFTRKEIEELRVSLIAKKSALDEWKFITKTEMEELEIEQNGTEEKESGEKSTDYTNW